MASIAPSPSSSPPASVVKTDSIVTGACFPDQKSCTKAMRQGMPLRSYNAKITGASTERLLYRSLQLRRSRLTASQVREDELIRSLVASDPRISGHVLVEHIKRIRGATISLNEAYRSRTLILEELYGSLEEGVQKLESLLLMWKTKNPTSHVDCDFNEDGEFVRAFVSHPYAPLYEKCGQRICGVDGAFS
ncbi:Uncharacterized protein PHPALM_11491 [Phytophthora palmivora]|uniref:Uncharacterized protein n=1 Tax=Phytophthora palmivora TaxID=4796 RepID=A0A2P4Y235_9STRA|nr:Uncharacterized protein PHPALM_11491 [Phytophthora palmivora]